MVPFPHFIRQKHVIDGQYSSPRLLPVWRRQAPSFNQPEGIIVLDRRVVKSWVYTGGILKLLPDVVGIVPDGVASNGVIPIDEHPLDEASWIAITARIVGHEEDLFLKDTCDFRQPVLPLCDLDKCSGIGHTVKPAKLDDIPEVQLIKQRIDPFRGCLGSTPGLEVATRGNPLNEGTILVDFIHEHVSGAGDTVECWWVEYSPPRRLGNPAGTATQGASICPWDASSSHETAANEAHIPLAPRRKLNRYGYGGE